MSRFDYVAYDKKAMELQLQMKKLMTEVETLIDSVEVKSAGVGRAKALALTKLEEVYMWVGKMVRDDQVARTGRASAE